MSPKDCAYIVEHLSVRFMAIIADHSRQLAEHRAAFGARTEADAKIIAGLRSEIVAARMAVLERDSLISERAKLQSIINEQSASAKEAGEKLGWTGNESAIQAVERVVRERDGLLTQVQDMRAEMQRLSAQLDWERAEIKRLQWENATMHKDAEDGYAEAIKVLGDPVALSKERDALRAEVAALKSQNPKQHPVKAGEWVRRTAPHGDGTPAGSVQQVRAILPAGTESSTVVYEMKSGSIWAVDYCEPCDPPATHDTEAGKAAAESALKTEPVAEEIKVGDVVEVVSNTGRNTWLTDVGSVGTVTSIETLEDSLSVRLKAVPDKKNVCGGYVSICDVRKVTT